MLCVDFTQLGVKKWGDLNMNDEINRKLEEAQQGVLRLQKINAKLEDLNNQQAFFTAKVPELKNILEKEQFDVDNLEGKSVSHMFHTIFGNFDEHLEKERKEALAARLQYDQVVRNLKTVNEQISNLNSEMIQYKLCESTYRELYDIKRDMLLESNSRIADKILLLSDQINITNNHIKEIKEAINAGDQVITHLENATASLNSAQGWGTWDLLGGGLISDLAKHSHIDEATREVEESQRALLNFRTELVDVRISNCIGIEIDGFSKFADFFFDGLIADWNMQSKIHKSQDSVDETKDQVQQVLRKLKSMKEEGALQVEQLKQKMTDLIIRA